MNYKKLQKKHPLFIYQGYSFKFVGDNLEVFFDFKTEPDIYFRPKIVLKNVPKNKNIDNLVFNLGLIEMISYWKAACSPKIEVRAGYLNESQIKWWQSLILKGMGQFFFENKMPFLKPEIKASGKKQPLFNKKLKKKVLVPVGGGKDSVVSLEIIKKSKMPFFCFSLNPTEGARKIVKAGKCKTIITERKIDKKLLELNKKGYLNGHTPFSAYLAFLTALTAGLFGAKYIALSNERSSNEGNLKYLGKTVNHQWSKSFEFERMFRSYSKKYLLPELEYFSLLRPLYEIQIAKLFSSYKKYFPLFMSCNEAYKTDSGRKKATKKWCGKCSKCLFVFSILYPFVKEEELVKIFGKNLFKDKSLIPLMKELIGERKFKPLECVGTEKESLTAFYLSLKKNKDLPLLKYFEKNILPKYPNLRTESEKLMGSFDKNNAVQKDFVNFIGIL